MNVTAVKVIAGYDHMLLLSTDGELWTWGAGANGETAQNTTVRRMIPHPVLFQAVTSSPTSGYSISEASTQQNSGEESKSDDINESTPNGSNEDKASEEAKSTSNSATTSRQQQQQQRAEEVHGPFIDIGIGRNFSIAINQRGECYSFGNARNGVLGNGKTEGVVALATRIDTQANFTKVFVSRDHVMAFGSGDGALIAQPPPPPPSEADTSPSDTPSSSTPAPN